MAFTFTINGHTYTSDPANTGVAAAYHFDGYNYLTALGNLAVDLVAVAASAIAAAASALNAPGTQATSGTSFTLGVGPMTFTLDQADKDFPLGVPVSIARTSDPAKVCYGTVTALADPDLTVDVTKADIAGGPFTDWTIALCGPAMASVINELKGANIASAATIDLDVATGNLVHVTGTTGITAMTLASGAERTVVFDGVLTLTHNAVSLILPGGADITTAAGDVIKVRGDGAGNARVVGYSRASGRAIVQTGVPLSTVIAASSATVDIETTFDSAYDHYIIRGDGIKVATDNVALYCQLKLGGAYVTTATYSYHTNVSLSNAATYAGSASAADSQIKLSGSCGNAADESASLEIHVRMPTSTTLQKIINWIGETLDDAGRIGWASGVGSNTGTGALTGVRIFAASGNIASGTFRLYGVPKA